MAHENTTQSESELTTEKAQLAWSAINKCQNIALVSHRNPDPDCIGSNLSLQEVLNNHGKRVDSFCTNSPPNSCGFLENIQSFQQDLDPTQYDLIISLDCGSPEQLGYYILREPLDIPFINIDHHPSNKHFGTINLVYPNYSSTSEIIFYLLKLWDIPLTTSIATNLLIGLYYDTGSFMHSNVNPDVLNIASALMQAGADLAQIHKHLFQNFSENKYHLWGETLENIHLTKHGTAIAVIENNKTTTPDDRECFSGLIDYVSMTKDSQFAVMITQDDSEQIKGSLRTRHDNINLSQLASELGGGGHRKASGFNFPGQVKKESIWTITNH